MKKTWDPLYFVLISLLVLSLVTIPYILAEISGGESLVFNGFLLNPIDGNTYLAKMYQGWEGEWRFQLPFTAEPGVGAYLFMFYLGLGHLARVLSMPLLIVFHIVRILSSILLLWSLWEFYGSIFGLYRVRRLAFGLGALGSGVGWLLVPLGFFTSDFWVAETYPFLSAYANPHFPLGLAMVLWLVKPRNDIVFGTKTFLRVALTSLFLSVINPFGVVVSLMVLAGQFFWAMFLRSESKHIFKIALTVVLFSLPVLVYDNWIIWSDPVFKEWNAQNLTPSPAFWDLLISLSPSLLLGAWGIISWVRSNPRQPDDRISGLVFWAFLGLIAIYLPMGLQRRFMMGLFVPLAGLAAIGIEDLSIENLGRYRFLTIVLFLFSLPTNILILLAANSGVQSRNPQIYLSSGEFEALTWITKNTSSDDLILSSPEMGIFVPAYTGRRVLYGHPFETIHAEKEERAVADFYQGGYSAIQAESFILDRDIDYIFWGPRERAIGDALIQPEWEEVFKVDDVYIYQPFP